MVHLSFGENDQGLAPGLQNLDRDAECLSIRAIAVDGKCSMFLQHVLLEPGCLAEDLPGGHEVGGRTGLIRRLVKQIRIGIGTVIRRNQHALSRRNRGFQSLQAA